MRPRKRETIPSELANMGNGSKDKLLEDEGIGESNGAQIVNSSEASRQGK
jgi:hypothetical protein